MTETVTWIWLIPRNLLIAILIAYRKLISPLYGEVCRYYPSCSSYGLQQVQQRGVILGIVLSAWRVLRCNPWSAGGVDEVTPGNQSFGVTKYGFVAPVSFTARKASK
jgi:putative membrane protein insertion efficiency factor